MKINKEIKKNTNYNNTRYSLYINRNYNIKYIIFLTRINLLKKKYGLFGKTYEERLLSKGILACSYHTWFYSLKNHGLYNIKFDLNDDEPSHSIVYKKFTDKQYLSIDKYSTYQFQEQCRSLTTLVGYLGVKKIRMVLNKDNNSSFNMESGMDLKKEVKGNINISNDNKDMNNHQNIKEFEPYVSKEMLYSCKSFDDCARNGGLFGVDCDVYKQMNFINIVSERYNGQYISYFNINKELYSKDSLDIGLFINKLNIGVNTKMNYIKHQKEAYTFIIEYYKFDELKINNIKNIICEKYKDKLICSQFYSPNSSPINPNNPPTNNPPTNDPSIDNPPTNNPSTDNSPTNNPPTNNLSTDNSLINNINNDGYTSESSTSSNNITNEIYIPDILIESSKSENIDSNISKQKSLTHSKEDDNLVKEITDKLLDINKNNLKVDINKINRRNSIKKIKSFSRNNSLIKNNILDTSEMIQNLLYEDDIDNNMNNEIDLIIQNYKKDNNIKLLKNYIMKYAKDKHKEEPLKKWESKYNDLDERCRWITCKSDIDRFLDKI